MGLTFERKKKKNLLLSFIYRLSKLPFLSAEKKFTLFLNLEWVFERLAHEIRVYSSEFLLQFIKPEYAVLDLGCKYGEISFTTAAKAKKVVGIDFDEAAIEKAKTLYKKANLSFEVGDALVYLKNNSEKFDVLILSHILEHIEKPKDMIIDLKKLVDFIYVEVPDFDKSYLNHYRKDFGCDLIYTDPDHISEFDRVDLLNLFKECELEVLSSEYRFGVQRYWLKP
jgi:SAM-dependent methyltransferase